MGIRGLTTYINRNPGSYQDHVLHGGHLVIDGISLACVIYKSSGCNCCFGGDYDRYARLVGEFFDELLKCEVTPLVIFDGGMELKKMKTTFERTAELLRGLSSRNPASKDQFTPPLIIVVFITVLREKGIKMARCVFEADSGIAGVAKVLDCPVLSNDSDFYIFGTSYIPMFSLERFAVKNGNGQGYAKRCKLYKTENLLESFPDLDPSVLPLAAALLGNDYIEKSIFEGFYDSLMFSSPSKRLYSVELQRIDTIFRWLQHYDLNDAITVILSKLPKKHRSKVLNMMELVINSYVVLPIDMLVPLGFEKEFRREQELRRNEKPFEYERYDVVSELRQLWNKADIADTDDSSSSDEETESTLENETSGTIDFEINTENEDCNEKVAETWPAWFYRCYSTAELPNDFVDLMSLRLYAFSTRMEDSKYPSVAASCIDIIRVIDGLLVAGRDGNVPGFSYVTRDGTKLVRRYIEKPLRGTRTTKFPPLSELPNTDSKIRKRIMDDTLDITDKAELLEDVPPEWRLYVAVVSYWIKKSNEPPLNSSHVYAIFLTMLFGIIDEKIGYHRLPEMFERRYGKTVAEIMSKRTSSQPETAVAPNSLLEAVEAIGEDDCWLAASFFVANFRMDAELFDHPEEFNVTIVHVFEHFQACLKHAVRLNALLGYPYEDPVIAKLYNGTMLYNFYKCFTKVSDIETYVAVKINNSSSLMNVLKLLTIKMKSILEGTNFVFDDGAETHH